MCNAMLNILVHRLGVKHCFCFHYIRRSFTLLSGKLPKQAPLYMYMYIFTMLKKPTKHLVGLQKFTTERERDRDRERPRPREIETEREKKREREKQRARMCRPSPHQPTYVSRGQPTSPSYSKVVNFT